MFIFTEPEILSFGNFFNVFFQQSDTARRVPARFAAVPAPEDDKCSDSADSEL